MIQTERETDVINKDVSENKTGDTVDKEYTIWLNNLQLIDDGTINTEMIIEMVCAGKVVEFEHKKHSQDCRGTMKHKAGTTKLHFPFGNDKASLCTNVIQNKDNTRKKAKEVETPYEGELVESEQIVQTEYD